MTTSIEIKIAIIGPKERITLVRDVLRDFPNINPTHIEVDNLEEGMDRINSLESTVESLLFTDYYMCQEFRLIQKNSIPSRYIPVTTNGLYEVLFRNRESISMSNMSIDTISTHQAISIIDNLKSCHVNFLAAPKELTHEEDILNFHLTNYEKNDAIIFSAIQSVVTKLNNIDIPCELIPLTRLDVVNALERTLLTTQTRLNNESQTIIGILKPDKTLTSKQNMQLERIINIYVDSLDGYTTGSNHEGTYVFVSTRGVFERESRGYKFLPLLHESKATIGIGLSMGIGFGYTAREAGKNAQLAFTQSSEAGGDTCYIVREDRSVFGPVASTSSHAYDKYQITITNPKLIEQAEMLGMSATYMNKIMSRVARYNQLEYTANDLSEILDITLRSANRILLKWIDAGLVSIIGEEKATRHGRPRRVYRLNFITNLTIDQQN